MRNRDSGAAAGCAVRQRVRVRARVFGVRRPTPHSPSKHWPATPTPGTQKRQDESGRALAGEVCLAHYCIYDEGRVELKDGWTSRFPGYRPLFLARIVWRPVTHGTQAVTTAQFGPSFLARMARIVGRGGAGFLSVDRPASASAMGFLAALRKSTRMYIMSSHRSFYAFSTKVSHSPRTGIPSTRTAVTLYSGAEVMVSRVGPVSWFTARAGSWKVVNS